MRTSRFVDCLHLARAFLHDFDRVDRYDERGGGVGRRRGKEDSGQDHINKPLLLLGIRIIKLCERTLLLNGYSHN